MNNAKKTLKQTNSQTYNHMKNFTRKKEDIYIYIVFYDDFQTRLNVYPISTKKQIMLRYRIELAWSSTLRTVRASLKYITCMFGLYMVGIEQVTGQ